MSYYSKTCNFTICSIYRHGGHDGWSAGSSDITFKGNPLRMIQVKFGLNWPSGFRGEDFFKSLQTDDGRQVMAIAHTGELKIVNYLCIRNYNYWTVAWNYCYIFHIWTSNKQYSMNKFTSFFSACDIGYYLISLS